MELLNACRSIAEHGGLWAIEAVNGYGASHHFGDPVIPLFLHEENAVAFPIEISDGIQIVRYSTNELIDDHLLFLDRGEYKILLPDAVNGFDIDLYPAELARFLMWASSGTDPMAAAP